MFPHSTYCSFFSLIFLLVSALLLQLTVLPCHLHLALSKTFEGLLPKCKCDIYIYIYIYTYIHCVCVCSIMLVVCVCIVCVCVDLLLLLVARASAAARGVSISWLARAETRVLALSSPEIYFEISVFVGICGVFSQKKRAHGGLHWSKNLLGGPFRIVFFGVFLSVSPFASVFAVFWPSLNFLHMPASTCTCF